MSNGLAEHICLVFKSTAEVTMPPGEVQELTTFDTHAVYLVWTEATLSIHTHTTSSWFDSHVDLDALQ